MRLKSKSEDLSTFDQMSLSTILVTLLCGMFDELDGFLAC